MSGSSDSGQSAKMGTENNKQHTIEDLIGDSSPMVQLRALIGKAARSDATVLITGENGTGKELVAKALHFESSRRDGPFIDVNAAALTETLVESELFGHERGSFTGAVIRRRGDFEQAHGSSIFFDEIGDLPVVIQAKLLRVLQERSFRRVGGEEKIHIDVRVIAATNRNLEDAMKAGAFRMDLFYRIYVVVIEVPPLRARKSDIPELTRHLLSKSSRVRNRANLEISGEAMDMLCKHSWPGNVRELENAMERALIVCETNEILPSHLPPALIRGLPAAELNSDDQPRPLLDVIAQIERSMIVKTLRETKGNQSEAARSLGLTRRTLSYKMVNLGIEKSPVDGLRPFHASTDDENGDKKAH
jgi:transcriptional regulator with PAS, ATPase and Fis domain